ncbi:MAG: histidine kinase [Lachnospiraceae bacterium]|nr:histidine kinase [Lachnospiraceae bacterium]
MPDFTKIKKCIPKTIRGKIIACTAATTLVITALTVTICFQIFQNFLRRNQLQSVEYNLQVVSRNVADDMENILYFGNWCRSNEIISRYLESFRSLNSMPPISSSDVTLRMQALNAFDRLKEEYHNTNSARYLSRVLISPANRRNYLQLAGTSATTTSAAADVIYQSEFFRKLYESWDYRWIGFVQDPLSPQKQVIPILRPIYNQYNSEIIGWMYFSVSSQMILDCLKSFPLNADSSLYITIGSTTYQYRDGVFSETGLDFSVLSAIENATLNPGTRAEKIRLADGSRRTMLTCPLWERGWTISCILSERDFHAQRTMYSLIIVGISIAIVLLGTALYLMLNRTINRPLAKIRNKVNAIALGDFSRDGSIEWPDEFGTIGKGINNMADNVVTLMNRRVEDEKQKKDLEYQILQSQINPHFLYNTLNSIKWMATIQNASGIAEMTTALARLMKSVSKGAGAFTTLKGELDLVKDYFLIQQYRYGGSISIEYQIADEELLACRIHRFTLQPIIENALFHGIEPKGCAGKILLKADRLTLPDSKPALQISVTDNGIGMSEETIRKVLYENAAPTADFFKQVGIHNVNQRIRHDFGEGFGIRITSKPGEFTTMTITLPYQTEGGERL